MLLQYSTAQFEVGFIVRLTTGTKHARTNTANTVIGPRSISPNGGPYSENVLEHQGVYQFRMGILIYASIVHWHLKIP